MSFFLLKEHNYISVLVSGIKSFADNGFLPHPHKKAEQNTSMVCVQFQTIIEFAALKKKKPRIQTEWRERDMLALRVIACQALIRAAVFYRSPVRRVMDAVDFHDLQAAEEKEMFYQISLVMTAPADGNRLLQKAEQNGFACNVIMGRKVLVLLVASNQEFQVSR